MRHEDHPEAAAWAEADTAQAMETLWRWVALGALLLLLLRRR